MTKNELKQALAQSYQYAIELVHGSYVPVASDKAADDFLNSLTANGYTIVPVDAIKTLRDALEIAAIHLEGWDDEEARRARAVLEETGNAD